MDKVYHFHFIANLTVSNKDYIFNAFYAFPSISRARAGLLTALENISLRGARISVPPKVASVLSRKSIAAFNDISSNCSPLR